MDGGDTASTWSLCRRRFLGSTLKPSSGRPATRMNMSINAAGRRWSLRNCSRRAATSAEVSEKNCSRSNSLREAARPPCRRSEGRRRAWQWAAAGGRSMYRRGCRQCSREISRRGWQRLRSLVVTGSQAKVHQSARKVRLPRRQHTHLSRGTRGHGRGIPARVAGRRRPGRWAPGARAASVHAAPADAVCGLHESPVHDAQAENFHRLLQ